MNIFLKLIISSNIKLEFDAGRECSLWDQVLWSPDTKYRDSRLIRPCEIASLSFCFLECKDHPDDCRTWDLWLRTSAIHLESSVAGNRERNKRTSNFEHLEGAFSQLRNWLRCVAACLVTASALATNIQIMRCLPQILCLSELIIQIICLKWKEPAPNAEGTSILIELVDSRGLHANLTFLFKVRSN